jgi:two-component system response regulator HydG
MVEGNREQAANILGIGERTLYRKIKEYGLKD